MDRLVQQDTVEIFVVSRVKSIEFPASESNGLIESTPNKMQKDFITFVPPDTNPVCAALLMFSALLL